MLYYTRPEKLAREKHSSLFGPFISYEENKVLRIRPIGAYDLNFLLIAICKLYRFRTDKRLFSTLQIGLTYKRVRKFTSKKFYKIDACKAEI